MKRIKQVLSVILMSILLCPATSNSQCPLEKSIYGGFYFSQDAKPALFGDYLGASLFNIGDIDRDGVNDFAAAAYRDIASGHFYPAVKIWSGKTKSLIATIKTSLLPSESFFGGNIIPAGDLDGDGYGDILLTETRVNFHTQHRGKVYAYTLFPQPKLLYTIVAPQIIESSGGYDSYGESAVSLGDLNSDGVPEFAVSAPGYNDSERENDDMYEGAVFIHSGANGQLLKFIIYDSPEVARFGRKIFSASDITGDGVKDLAVSYEYNSEDGSTGAVNFYNGATLSQPSVDSKIAQIVPEIWNRAFGESLIDVGDYNADGLGEVAISQAGLYVKKAEPVVIFTPQKSFSGISFSVLKQIVSIDQGDTDFGASMALLLDYDNDGKGEVAISSAFLGYGKVEIFSSATNAILQTLTSVAGDKYGARFGREITLLGDTDSDGFDELAIAAPESLDGVDFSNVGLNFTTGSSPDAGAIEIFSISFDKNLNGILDACEAPTTTPTTSTPLPNQTAQPEVNISNLQLKKPTFKVNGKNLEIYMDAVAGAKYSLTYTVKLPKAADGKVKKPKTKTIKIDSPLFSFKLPKAGSSIDATYSVYTEGVSASTSKDSPKGKFKVKMQKRNK